MLPKTGDVLNQDFTVREQPSKTYRIQPDRLSGYVDNTEAVKQAVSCILNTERFQHLIYSWNYGVEFSDLAGKPMGYVISEIKKRIRKALMQDDRILGVDAFLFEESKGKLSVTFTVSTIFGDIKFQKEVMV